MAEQPAEVDDGLRSGLVSLEQLEAVPLFSRHLAEVRGLYPDLTDRRLIHETVRRMINPKTRLLDVVVALPDALRAPLPAGLPVQGEIVLATGNDWVVPRSAVLSDAKGAYLFQVENGHARRINVTTGTATDAVVAVKGSFDPRAPVVTEGNYELRDGMAVREGAQ